MSRPTFTDRRRAQLARRVAALEAMEERNMITESLGVLSLGVGVQAAAAAFRPTADARAAAHRAKPGASRAVFLAAPVRPRAPGHGAGWSPARTLPAAAARQVAAAASGGWLTLFRRPVANAAAGRPAHAPSAPTPNATSAGGSSRGGTGGGSGDGGGGGSGGVTPLRLPPPTPADGGDSGAIGAALGTAAPAKAAPTAPASTPAVPSRSAALQVPSLIHTPLMPPDPGVYSVVNNASPAALGQFSHFPLYTLDYNDGTVLFPGAYQIGTANGNVDLRAQVRDTTVSSYSWDTSGLTDAAPGTITGTGTYRLQFRWKNSVSTATDTVTLTVTNNSSQTEIQTYTFWLPAKTVGVPPPPLPNPGSGTATWPEALSPDTVRPAAPAVPSHNVTVDADSGALDTAIPLPGYNPNLAPLVLTYDSLLADPRPVVVEHHALDDSLSTPTKVSGQLTFNGSTGTPYYYDTSQFIPGDVQQIALQANATGLSTGRYAYTVTVGDVRGSTTTTTVNGTATVLNGASNAFGAGWTLRGLEKITTASGGVILDLGSGGRSLWFSGSGTYTSPAGEFSTVADVGGGGYTRTLTDGTVYRFNSGGYETSVADRNGLRVTFAYDGSNNLSTVTDPYGKITTFSYSGGTLSTVTDPAARIATFTHSGSNLTGVTLPDAGTWGYAYDGAHRLTQVTDPRSKTVTVAYGGAERASTVTRPDATAETFTAYQERGYDTSGTSGSPAAATLLAEARGSHTDPNGHTTDLRPDWKGLGLPNEATDPDGNVTTADRDGNGLATVVIDRLNRVTQYAYDGSGNVTQVTYPDLGTDQYGSYNAFAEPSGFTNARGKTTNFAYDGHGNLTSQDGATHVTTYTYTGNGRLATVKDARNNVTTYQYDSQDRLTTVTFPDTTTNLTAYDTKGNPTTVTDGRGNVTSYAYDALNRPTGVTDALSNRTTYVYDASGNVTAVQAPLSRTTTYAYDAMDRVTTVTDPLSHSTVVSYDSGGNVKTVTDPLSRVTTLSYDAEDRRTVVTDPLGHSTTTAYDAEGQVVNVTDPLSRVTTVAYNARGWKATVTDPLSNVTTYTYNATGMLATVSDPANGGAALVSTTYDDLDQKLVVQDELGNTSTYAYDAVGNFNGVQDPMGDRTTYVYDSRNRLTTLTDPLGHSTVRGYDSGGNQTTFKDALGNVTTTLYDALSRVATVTDARTAATTVAYDAAGRRIGLTDSNGNRTTWAYDAADRLTTMTDPLNHSSTYTYDNANELTDKTDRDGRRTTYSFDSGGRRTGETWVGASPSEIATYAYDAADQLTGVADANATLTFAYDSGGRQTVAATSGGAGQPLVTLTYGYNATGDRTSMTDNLTSVGRTTYVYDHAHRLTTLTRSLGGTAGPQVIYGYDNGSRTASVSRTIAGSGTAVTTSIAYDNSSRVGTITHQVAGGAALATHVYGYDNGDRVTSETNAEGTVAYGYDAANELTGASGSRTEAYTYDSGGNRTMTGYTTGTGNQLTASPGTTYTYDNEGNMTARADTTTHVVTSYTYDYRNRLTGVTVGGTAVATYVYDALDRRIGFKDNGTQTWVVWDGQNPYADFNGGGTLQQRYLYGLAVDALLARTDSGGTTAWYLTDRLRTARDIANTSGTVIDHLSYDSFGSVLTESNSGNGDRFNFTGREYDSTTGLYYYRARYYGPNTGRFIRRDPMEFAAGDTNLYRYVGNSPTNLVDPTGLDGGFWDSTPAQFMAGIGQGLANIGNGLTDAAIGTANMLKVVNPGFIATDLLLGNPVFITPPDWSTGLITSEDPTLHEVSKFVGTEGALFLTGVGITKLVPACFTAGTPLLTPDGSKPIEAFQPGDWILSMPEGDPEGRTEPRQVEAVFRSYGPTYELRAGGRTIRTTGNHPFWIQGRGWTAANQLMEGDLLLGHAHHWLVVESVKDVGEESPLFNLRVAEFHTYFVGSSSWGFAVWAHNACKIDIEKINAIQKKVGMSDDVREIFHEELHMVQNLTDGKELSFKEMLELAKEIMKQFPNK